MILHVSIYIGFIIIFLYFLALIESQKLDREINRADHLNQRMNHYITDKDLEHCPELLRKYLNFVGVKKKAFVNKVTIFRKGKAKKLIRFKWARYHSKDYYFLNTHSYFQNITLQVFPLIFIKINNKFRNSCLEKFIYLFSSVIIEKSNRNFEESHNSLISYFRSMIYVPSAFLDKNIEWKQIGSNVLYGEYNLRGYKVDAYFSIDENLEIKNFVTHLYFNEKGKYELKMWSCQFSEYDQLDEIWIPTKSKMIWHEEDGNVVEMIEEVHSVEYA